VRQGPITFTHGAFTTTLSKAGRMWLVPCRDLDTVIYGWVTIVLHDTSVQKTLDDVHCRSSTPADQHIRSSVPNPLGVRSCAGTWSEFLSSSIRSTCLVVLRYLPYFSTLNSTLKSRRLAVPTDNSQGHREMFQLCGGYRSSWP
jgi:hypothetical protein